MKKKWPRALIKYSNTNMSSYSESSSDNTCQSECLDFGYVNASNICEAYGKSFQEWRKSNFVNEMFDKTYRLNRRDLQKICREIDEEKFSVINKGLILRNNYSRKFLIHPHLIPHLSLWCDPDCHIEIFNTAITNFFYKKKKEKILDNIDYKLDEITEMLEQMVDDTRCSKVVVDDEEHFIIIANNGDDDYDYHAMCVSTDERKCAISNYRKSHPNMKIVYDVIQVEDVNIWDDFIDDYHTQIRYHCCNFSLLPPLTEEQMCTIFDSINQE